MTQNFTYNGSTQSTTVPADTYQMTVTATAAYPDLGTATCSACAAQITTTVPVGGSSPFQVGDALDVFAGGEGGNAQLSDFRGWRRRRRQSDRR